MANDRFTSFDNAFDDDFECWRKERLFLLLFRLVFFYELLQHPHIVFQRCHVLFGLVCHQVGVFGLKVDQDIFCFEVDNFFDFWIFLHQFHHRFDLLDEELVIRQEEHVFVAYWGARVISVFLLLPVLGVQS